MILVCRVHSTKGAKVQRCQNSSYILYTVASSQCLHGPYFLEHCCTAVVHTVTGYEAVHWPANHSFAGQTVVTSNEIPDHISAHHMPKLQRGSSSALAPLAPLRRHTMCVEGRAGFLEHQHVHLQPWRQCVKSLV
jgi:hypothetical protein